MGPKPFMRRPCGAPKAQDLLAAGIDELAVGIVQMKVPGELLDRRGAGEPPVAVLLLGGQEADRHGGFAKLVTSANTGVPSVPSGGGRRKT
jgi:hypothetical protein